MGWRVVTITSPCKLSYKNDYMLIRGEKEITVYIPEIDTLLIETTQSVITTILLVELLKAKVNIVYCDEKHNPIGNVLPFSGCHNSSKKVLQQFSWDRFAMQKAFTTIIRQKIINQANVLYSLNFDKEAKMLYSYVEDLRLNDETNREGHAAKVYFNALFGKEFSRDAFSPINDALNYGYMVLLSCFNRAVAVAGYITQIGIKHINSFNPFNYSCDLIEPFRVIVDHYVYNNPPQQGLDKEYKHNLLALLQSKVKIDKEYFLIDAIELYVKKTSEAISSGEDITFLYEF